MGPAMTAERNQVSGNDKFGKVLGIMILIAGVLYFTYQIPFWIDRHWRTLFCYLVALLPVPTVMTLIAGHPEPKREVS
jgi:hypothetical protein